MLPSWKDWCRLCANEKTTLKLESFDVINTILWQAMQISINELPEDALAICNDCYKLVNKLDQFKQRYEQTNRMFFYLSNISNIGLSSTELRKIRDRYLDVRCMDDGAMKEDSECGTEQMIQIIPITDLMNSEDQVKLENPANERLSHNVDTVPNASDTEQWETNEIDYEDVRFGSYSDSVSHDIKIEEIDCMADANLTVTNPIDDENVDKTSSKNRPLRRTRATRPRAPVFRCDICLKTFNSSSYFKKHEATHALEEEKKLYACNLCGKTYNKATNVKAHIRLVHDGDKPFICEECGKAFGSKGALKEHYIVHTDDRPFQCTRCSKRFKNAARLKTHEDIHNDTLYVCPHCGLQLNTKRTLNMHMVVHSDQKKYKCQFCGNEYKRSKALKSHLILHTGLRPYNCPFCDRTFANGSNCRSHKKKFHPIELAALEAAGGQKPATNIPKLENLRHKAKNNVDETDSSEKVAPSSTARAAAVGTASLESNTKFKTAQTIGGQKKSAHRIPVENRIKITS